MIVARTALTCLTAAVVATAGPAAVEPSLAELWVEPAADRNLFHGPGGPTLAPVSGARYELLETDPSGFSITYKARDERGGEWNIKIGPEAQTEVVASRIVWALGYHQLPTYFLDRWTAVEKGTAQVRGGARFRPRNDGLDSKGVWHWRDNPFRDTPAFRGLLVLMMLLNSTDLKDLNNEIYDVTGPPREGARRWFVVKDLGASLGETGRLEPRRGYIDGFEKEPFITGVSANRVEFGFRGRHQDLTEGLTVADVRWLCERVHKVTDRQWQDAFGAAGYTEDITRRFVARIKQKADEGLALR